MHPNELDKYAAIVAAKMYGGTEWEHCTSSMKDSAREIVTEINNKIRASYTNHLNEKFNFIDNCQFCGKNRNEVKILVAGPMTSICNECVGLAMEII